METLFVRSAHIIRQTNMDFCRYMLKQIDWGERLIAIKGARGTGKTTLMLQYIKRHVKENVLFISMDDLYFGNHTLLNVATDFYNRGGRFLFLDEVHKYQGWSQEIKNLYDTFKKLHIVFSSSSALQIDHGEADLSRRAVKYTLHELSFREYIALNHDIVLPTFTLPEILKNHEDISQKIAKKIIPVKLFEEYLKYGSYPFIVEGKINYLNKLRWVVNQVIECDLPAIEHITYESVIKLKKLLMVLSCSVPYKPNITTLSQKTSTSRDQLLKYLKLLDDARLIAMLRQQTAPTGYLTKPEKLFLNNTSLFHALSEGVPNIGAVRETFFMNQLSAMHQVNYAASGDFLVDKKWVFEIGGNNKPTKQISNIKHSYIAADNIETGYGRTISLWLFGFLY